MISVFSWYFLSLQGRISAQEFRLGFFGLLAVSGILIRVMGAIVFYNTSGKVWDKADLFHALWLPIPMTVTVVIWPLIAISVKRLHDADLSGWWMLTVLALPFVARLFSIDASTLLVGAFLAIGVISGSTGSNRFGQRPPRPRPAN